jgi:hypothetical protein
LENRVQARLTPREGRRFAFTVGIALLIIAGITWWRDHFWLVRIFSILSGLLLLAGILVPGLLSPVFRAWMRLARLISKVTTPIFMGVTYFIVLTPIGLIMRLLGKNPMVRKASDGSFWISRNGEGRRRSDLERQF